MALTPPPTASADLQFAAASGKLYYEKITDPTGNPLDVLDMSLGAVLEGRVELPGWLNGQGTIRVMADQIGGPFDGKIGDVPVTVAGGSGIQSYPWIVPLTLTGLTPDEMYHVGLVFILKTPAGVHNDIGGFLDLGVFLVV